MAVDTSQALLAGFLSGAAGALAHTAILLMAIMRAMRSDAIARGGGSRLPGWEHVRPAVIGVMLVNILMLAWTALGLVLGAAFLRVESDYPLGSLGVPNWLFTGLVVMGAGIVLGLTAIVRSAWVGRTALASAGVAVLVFGFMLPNLATAP